MSDVKIKKAVVLSAGGGRAAYQVGVLRAMAEIGEGCEMECPFQIFSGISAGAINATFLAARAETFSEATLRLAELWSDLMTHSVYRTDFRSLGVIGLKWLRDFIFGGMVRFSHIKSLVDTTPIRKLLAKVINFNQIRKNLKNNVIEAVAISAANYSTGQNIIFVESKKPFENWYRVHRRSEKTRLKLKHVMASAAIPLLFPPVKIGCHFYGDGSLLNHTPISPAIHLGADRIMVIGVRQASVLEDDTKAKTVQPTVGRVFSLSLNALFMDALEADLERIKISNSCMRRIETLYIQPSRDIGEIASENASKLPGSVRYLVRGLGSMEEASELISYIMFEPEYCRKLIDLGYQDAIGRKEEIRDFLRC